VEIVEALRFEDKVKGLALKVLDRGLRRPPR
jgi:hypothetical protein